MLTVAAPFRTVMHPHSFENSRASLILSRLTSAAVHPRILRIALTEMEYALLARLLAEEGRAVSQEELLRDVWQGEAGVGTVTVYIHYLRQKLEAEGERVLRIKRGCGYYIDEKYAKGAILC